MTPENALQAAVYSRLTGYSPLTNALGGPKVYDFVPQGTAFPYVVVGDDTLVDWGTKTALGWDATLTLHAWGHPNAGRKSVKAILSHLYAALHQQEASVILSGFALVSLRFEFGETFQEPGITDTDRLYHGVQRYRALIQ